MKYNVKGNTVINNQPSHLMMQTDRSEYFPVFFMFLSLANMLLCLALIFFTTSTLSYMLCFVAYTCLAVLEIRNGIKSPVTLSVTCVYFGLTILSTLGFDLVGYAGIIIFSWLIALLSVLFIFGKPFTAYYSRGKGLRILHVVNSSLWLLAYLLSLLASLYFMPNELFIVIPYLICCCAGCLTLFFNLVWFGWHNERQRDFIHGNFIFRQITISSKDFDEFCAFFALQVVNDPRRKGVTLDSKAATQFIRDSELKLGCHSVIFCVYDGTKIIGSVRCILEQTATILPIEKDIVESFSRLRNLGKIMQIGRLGIDEKFRERPDVISGLFKCIIDLALEKDVHFIVGEAAKHRLPLYLKLGFELIFSRNDPRSTISMPYGSECIPVLLNFSRLVFVSKGQVQQKYRFSESINRYLLERWYKRSVLKNYFKSTSLWPWLCDAEDLKKLFESDKKELAHA